MSVLVSFCLVPIHALNKITAIVQHDFSARKSPRAELAGGVAGQGRGELAELHGRRAPGLEQQTVLQIRIEVHWRSRMHEIPNLDQHGVP